ESGPEGRLIQDFLIETARRLPDKVALIAGDTRLTYAEIDRRSDALARTLVRNGVERGDRVVVFADNGPEAAISFWAVLKANAVVVMLNPLTRSEKLAWCLNDCRASALIADARLARELVPALQKVTSLRTVVISGDTRLVAEA